MEVTNRETDGWTERRSDRQTARKTERRNERKGQTELQIGIYTNMSMKSGCTCSKSDELGCGGKKA
jgi:hypothetical protein